jgi:hypothetical protein
LRGKFEQDAEDMKLSVFCVFAGLFPEAVGENGAGGKMLIVSTREDVQFLSVVGSTAQFVRGAICTGIYIALIFSVLII